MGLHKDIKSIIDDFKGDDTTLKGLIQAVMFTQELSAKNFNELGKTAQDLSDFCKNYKRGVGMFSKKKPEHVLELENALHAYKQQSNLRRAYLKESITRDKILSDYEEKLQPVYLQVNKKIENRFANIDTKNSTDSEEKIDEIKEKLREYFDLIADKNIYSKDNKQAIENLRKELLSYPAKFAMPDSLDGFLTELSQQCEKDYVPIQKEKVNAVNLQENKVKTALDAWKNAYRESPLTWMDWEGVVSKTLRVIEDSQSSLWDTLENIQKNMRIERETSDARANEANVIADTNKRRLQDLESLQAEYETRSEGGLSKASRSSRGSNAGENLRLSGEEVDPMDDFQRLCQFWHPSKVILISIFATQLREFQFNEADEADADQSLTSITDHKNFAEKLNNIVTDLIMEKITVKLAIKLFTEIMDVKKSPAYSNIMRGIASGLIQLNENLADLKPGMDADVSLEEEAYYRTEKLSTIAEALRDNGSASLLPTNIKLASALDEVGKGLVQKYPEIDNREYTRKFIVKEVKCGSEKWKKFILETQNKIPTSPLKLSERSARVHVQWPVTPGSNSISNGLNNGTGVSANGTKVSLTY